MIRALGLAYDEMLSIVVFVSILAFFVSLILLVADLIKKKGKKQLRFDIVRVVVVFAAFIVFSLGLPSNTDAPSPTSSPNTSETQPELTDEEKAASQLEKATASFQDGDYMDAIEICSSISADYPNTETVANISAYLTEQFSQFPSFSATELIAAYDDNIVNADKEYTDTVMLVSGTVSSIDKTNSGSNLAVMLKSGTYFYGVQLNFKKSQTDAVAALSEGDNITVIGKCSGKSGKVLLVFDGDNVMIENCYIISQ